MSHHDDDDWDLFAAFMLAGEGRGWVLVFTTCAVIALLLYHYFG